jgi:hypothetical protein
VTARGRVSATSARAGGGGQFRAHARRSARLRALVTHVADGWQRQAEVVNIGLGGACIVVDEVLEPEDTVSLSFTAPTLWDPLVLRARVAWIAPARLHEPSRAGIAFEHKSAAVALALFELVNTISYE